MRLATIAVILVAGLLAACVAADKHFWELPDENLPYVAMLRASPNEGSVVVYNPNHCRAIGVACGFFRSQAHAHAMLNHQILSPSSYSDSYVRQADCWAARNADPLEVKGAVEFLRNENRDPEIRIVGNPLQRAKQIQACAERAGNWP